MKHLIANWKMNFINSDAWLKDFDLNNIPKEIQVVICPNYLDIEDFYEISSKTHEKILHKARLNDLGKLDNSAIIEVLRSLTK